MAEIAENITLGEAFEFARTRALTLDKGTEAKNIETLKNAVVAGKLGDKLIAKVKVQKKTNTLVFLTCEIINSQGIVAITSGVWKILKVDK